MGDQEMKIGKLNLKHLTQRERNFLLGGGGAALLLLLYLFIWAPLSDALDVLRQSNVNQIALNDWVKTTLGQVEQFRSRGISIQEIKKENLLSTLQDLLVKEQLNKYMDNMQEQSGKIAIRFKEVPFDRLIEWLEKIWKNYGVKVNQINVMMSETQGVVQANLVLEK